MSITSQEVRWMKFVQLSNRVYSEEVVIQSIDLGEKKLRKRLRLLIKTKTI